MKKQYKKYFIVNISAIIGIGFMLFFSGCEKKGKNAKENSVPTLTMATGAQPFALISVHAIHQYYHKCMKEDKHNRLSQSKLRPIQTEGIEK